MISISQQLVVVRVAVEGRSVAIIPPPPVQVSIAAVGVGGPPGATGGAGPPGEPGPAGTAQWPDLPDPSLIFANNLI